MLAVLALAGCDPAPSDEAPAGPRPSSVTFCRVDDVLDDDPPAFVLPAGKPLCLRTDTRLNGASIQMTAPDRAWAETARVASGRLVFPMPRRPGPLSVAVHLPDRVATLELRLVPTSSSASDLGPAERAMLFARKRQGEFREAWQKGELDRAVGVALETARLAKERGQIHTAARSLAAASYIHATNGRPGDAIDLLSEARALAAGVPVEWLHATLDHHESLTAFAAAAPRRAERRARRARQRYFAAGLEREAQTALAHEVLVLARLGRFEKAERLLAAHPLPVGTSTRSRALRTTNVADLKLRAWHMGRPLEPFELTLRRLEHAQALYFADGDEMKARDRRVERAWWLSLAGRAAEAKKVLGMMTEGDVSGHVRGLAMLSRAHLALLEGQPELAVEILDDLLDLPAGFDGLDGEIEVMGQVLRGRAELARGHPLRAAQALERAVEVAEQQSLEIPISLQPGAALRRRRPLRDEALDVLVSAGEDNRAFHLDDRLRAGLNRRLRSERGRDLGTSSEAEALRAQLRKVLSGRCIPPALETWCRQRSLEVLAEIDDVRDRLGQNLVRPPSVEKSTSMPSAKLEATQEIWIYTGTADRAPRFVVSAEGLSEEMRPLEALTHLYLVSDGPKALHRVLAREDLPPNLTLSLIPYASWLHREPRAPATELTVVVTDTLGDLSFARGEGKSLASMRIGPSWVGRSTTAPVLLDALRTASIFHFAGHGTVLSSDPWTTLLHLGQDEVLTLEDWVTRPPRLRLAVLNGCSTGGGAPAPGDLGFPQAMLETGTQTVLATTRPIRDALAFRFMEDFRKAGGHTHPGLGFRRAVQASQARGDRGWRAYQLWGRP